VNKSKINPWSYIIWHGYQGQVKSSHKQFSIQSDRYAHNKLLSQEDALLIQNEWCWLQRAQYENTEEKTHVTATGNVWHVVCCFQDVEAQTSAPHIASIIPVCFVSNKSHLPISVQCLAYMCDCVLSTFLFAFIVCFYCNFSYFYCIAFKIF